MILGWPSFIRRLCAASFSNKGVVESLNTRAGNLIFASAFATSLLGGKALSDGLGIWDWIAVALIAALGIAIAFMLWPYYNYRRT